MIKDPFARLGLDREVLTVSQLNGRARVLLEDVFTNIWVEGEISNLARPASGHVYFTLKDSGAQVRCALFRNNAARVRQALKDGLAVKVRGKVAAGQRWDISTELLKRPTGPSWTRASS